NPEPRTPNPEPRTPSACDEVDEPTLDVHSGERDADVIADVEPAITAHHPPFDRRRADAHVGALRARAGDDPVELLADARGDDERGGRLADLALHLAGRVLLRGAMRGKLFELVDRIRRRVAGQRRLQEALRDQIR